MSSSAIFPEFVVDDCFVHGIDPRDLNEVEAIIDSWFPQSATDPLLIGVLADAQMVDTIPSVPLSFSPPFFQPAGDAPVVVEQIIDEEPFVGLPSTTPGAGESRSDVAEQHSSQRKR
jgi:hypothetical protein